VAAGLTGGAARRTSLLNTLYLTQLLINLPSLCVRDLPAWLPDQWKRSRTAPPDALQK
jgi:hypothetical protein